MMWMYVLVSEQIIPHGYMWNISVIMTFSTVPYVGEALRKVFMAFKYGNVDFPSLSVFSRFSQSTVCLQPAWKGYNGRRRWRRDAVRYLRNLRRSSAGISPHFCWCWVTYWGLQATSGKWKQILPWFLYINNEDLLNEWMKTLQQKCIPLGKCFTINESYPLLCLTHEIEVSSYTRKPPLSIACSISFFFFWDMIHIP